jgi:hypothetical protein
MANGRSMYVRSVPMFLFVVIAGSVAFEIGRKKREKGRRKLAFSFLLRLIWIGYRHKSNTDWLIANKNINLNILPFRYKERTNEEKKF